MHEILKEKICSIYSVIGKVNNLTELGDGMINTTYIFSNQDNIRFVLQKIHGSFNIEGLMSNFNSVSTHLEKSQNNGNIDKDYKFLTLLYTKSGENYFKLDGGCWRISEYIENTTTSIRLQRAEDAFDIGDVLSKFHLGLSDFEGDLYNPLLGFHDTLGYYKKYFKVLEKTQKKRYSDWEDWLTEQKKKAHSFENLISSGKIKKRVTHNDTKVNNFLFDINSGKPVSLIDWDTISKELSVLIDLGDALRSLCHTEKEDGKIVFSEEVFEYFIKGYAQSGEKFLTKEEIQNIVFATELIISELSLRYYTSYLDGNKGFNFTYEGQIHDKGNALYQLWKDFDSKKEKLELIINTYFN